MVLALPLVLALAVTADPTPAEPRASDEGLHLTATVGTEFPVDVALCLTLDLPLRLQVSTSLGVMPGPYLALLNDVLVGLEVYDRTTADLIEAALKNSLVWRTQVGWRPLRDWGFYFQLGYTLAALGGELTGTEALAAAMGRQPPVGVPNRVELEAHSSLHMLGLELGYRWHVFDRVAIQLALGGFGTVAASTDLKSRNANQVTATLLAPYLAEGEQYLDSTYTRYVHAGYVSLQVGYRFF